MRTNIKLDLNDEDRRLLANVIDGKDTARLATRKDLQELVRGFVYGLASWSLTFNKESEPTPKLDTGHATHGRRYTDPEMQVVRRLEAQGRDSGYIRGWINACRGIGRLI